MQEDKQAEDRSQKSGVRIFLFCILYSVFYILPSLSHASISVKAEVDKKDALIGDRIIYTLHVTADKNLDLELPLDRPDFTPFDFIGQKGIEKKEDKGKITYKIDYVLVAYEVGELETPPQTVFFRDARGKEGKVSSEKVKIAVKGVVRDVQAKTGLGEKDIQPVKEPVAVEIKNGAGIGLLLTGVIFIMAVIIVSAFLYMKKREGQKEIIKPVLSPKDIALLELDRIEGLGLIEKGEFKRFHAMIGDCIKRFVSNGVHVPPAGLTAVELFHAISLSLSPMGGRGRGEGLDNIKDILTDCDLVEFAGYLPTDVESMMDIMKRAREVVMQVHFAV